jgi:hypothetical protein
MLCLNHGLVAIVHAAETDAPADWWAFWKKPQRILPQVKVEEAFVNLRQGPGSAYPVFHISERGDVLLIVKRKTDWIKVEDSQQRQGWIAVNDLLAMRNLSGTPVELNEPRFDDYTTHPWEAGLMAGNFDDSAVNAGYLGYWMTDNLSLEWWASQVIGDASESQMLAINLVHQIFPAWRFSPFFTLGAGKLFIEPKATLSQENKRSEEIVNAGLGFRYYLSNRYFLRFEYKDYKIFTNRDTNEEANEWKLGLSVFF